MKIRKTVGILLVLALTAFALAGCSGEPDARGARGESGSNQPENTEESAKERIILDADYPHYASLDDLAAKADSVLYGEVIAKEYDKISLRINGVGDDPFLNPEGDADDELTLVTVYTVNVIRSFKPSEGRSEVIKLLVIGGETDEAIWQTPESPDIRIGEAYVFFLSDSRTVENGAWLLNDTQALYCTDGTSISSPTDEGFELSFEALEALSEG